MKIPTRDVEVHIAAAIDRVEQVAKRAQYGTAWRAKGQLVLFGEGETTVGVIASTLDTFDSKGASAEHIALNDPAAVLRRCAAGREMLATIQAMRAKAEALAARSIGHAPWELFLYAARVTLSLAREWNVDLDPQEGAAAT